MTVVKSFVTVTPLWGKKEEEIVIVDHRRAITGRPNTHGRGECPPLPFGPLLFFPSFIESETGTEGGVALRSSMSLQQ
jgi:hypothetical protein